MTYIYLGSPYSNPDPEIMRQRFKAVERLTASLLIAGRFVYSPIVHCHELTLNFLLPKEFDFWRDYDFAMLNSAHQLWVHCQPGWNDSKGLSGEINKWLEDGMSGPHDYQDIRWVSEIGTDGNYLITTGGEHEEIIKGVDAKLP